MFNPKSDRNNYGDLLVPPGGYTLLRGVGTTYSLDLETLTAICIALGINDDTDGLSSQSPVCTLHSIENVASKVAVFCESGQMAVPKNASPLFLLLEKMIVPVALRTKKNGFYNSFHAKCWVLEFVDENGQKAFRFIVLSRNMTGDRSWDVAASFDGRRTREHSSNAESVRGFLKYLKESHLKKEQSGFKKNSDILDSLIKDLINVQFEHKLWWNDKPFTDMEILPIYNGNSILDKIAVRYEDMVIISPFVSDEVIRQLSEQVPYAGGSEKRTLITRASELKKVEPFADKFDVYVIKEKILNGENAEEGIPVRQQDIHAKMYLIKHHSWTNLYLGSMNASNGSTGGNVEMMIRLEVPNRYLNGGILLYDIFDRANASSEPEKLEDNNPFEKVSFPLNIEDSSIEQDNEHILVEAVKDICRQRLRASVIEDNGSYSIKLTAEKVPASCEVYVHPMRREDLRTPFLTECTYCGLSVTDLSEFYIISVRKDDLELRKVIVIPTKGIPQERDKKVVSGIINSQKAFLDYVCYILGNGSIADMLDLQSDASLSDNNVGSPSRTISNPALFELMLKAAADNKDKIRDIEKVMRLLSDEFEEDDSGKKIVSDEFKALYATFSKVLKLKKK